MNSNVNTSDGFGLHLEQITLGKEATIIHVLH